MHLESSPDSSVEVKASFSLRELVALLKSQTACPTLEQLNSWLGDASISEDDLRPYIGFKEANYWRHRICRNESVEMLVLCWRPGHRTPIHDHNGSHGAVKVFSGVLWETTFSYDATLGLCYKTAREWNPGEITTAAIPDIHQLGNPDVSGQNLITLHIYAPPLGVLKTYRVGSPVIDAYTPDDSDS
jgi:cysteine dioxygenase